ncbi:MAG: ABC-2 transporter permease [Pseudohongiella sp.]|nr:ABC-2 transporter permease [Pseudohongiella sp.]MDO9520585.1 ABC-2 transporter permease [Pseudohongiella sp.]MDP2126728.1 ABC-2 transporter permease [Pseudohongiella sp.]
MDTQLKQLIKKDLNLHRKFIPAVFAAGVASMVIAAISEFAFFVGSLLFITTLVAFGIMICVYSVTQERDKKIHLFVLSLPITSSQYTWAKVISSVICFAVPWAILFATVVAAILGLDSVLDSYLPYATLVMLYFLCNFCLFLTIIVVSSSEKVMVAAILVTNVCITIALQAFARVPSISQNIDTGLIVWSPTVLMIVLAEIVFCILCLSAAVYIQKQKTDLV